MTDQVVPLLPIISCAEAKRQGLKRYFTGKPCKWGHVCERAVINSRCVQCVRVYRQQPEVKMRARKWSNTYYHKPGVKERTRLFNQRPEVKARRRRQQRVNCQRPGVKERTRERRRIYNQQTEIRERKQIQARTYYHQSGGKEKARVYSQRPDVKARKRKWERVRCQRPEVKERNQQRIWMYRLQGRYQNSGRKQELALNYLRSIGAGHLLKTERPMPSGLSPVEKRQEIVRRRSEERSKALLIFKQLGLTSALDISGPNQKETT